MNVSWLEYHFKCEERWWRSFVRSENKKLLQDFIFLSFFSNYTDYYTEKLYRTMLL